jgi:transcriptional regulator with XRE-family HTH domain
MGSPVITNPKVRRHVASTLRKLLAQHQWSESELSRRTEKQFKEKGASHHTVINGVSQKHINNITNERTGCSVETLYELAKAFSMPSWQLLIPGRTESSVSPQRLSKIVLAYLNADEAMRSVMDRLAEQVKSDAAT